MKENKKLNALNVAGLYVGAIIGAGFASGREIWQFFGLFGEKGIYGVVIFAILCHRSLYKIYRIEAGY